MNFVTFSANTTNIFPIANTTKGGQLVTEYNLRSRESVATNPDVKYMIGPSYTHSMDDFAISSQVVSTNPNESSSTMIIAPGRCVLNGHFVENLVEMVIDFEIANMDKSNPQFGKDPNIIYGVGLKAMYSTETTISGSIKAENVSEMYEGVQVVVLPINQFKLPSDVPNSPSGVTAHLKLAEFKFNADGNIDRSSIQQNTDKIKYIDGDRVYNISQILSQAYISKDNLNPHMLYVFNTVNGESNWCDARDSLMLWDSNPVETTTNPNIREAKFNVNSFTNQVQLVLPHKSVDGARNTAGQKLYLEPKVYNVPKADYINETSGTVDKEYTKRIKSIENKVKDLYDFTAKDFGRLLGIIETLSDVKDLPKINAKWNIGDYILVNNDTTVGSQGDGVREPSTMYLIGPGYVKSVEYVSSNTTGIPPASLTGLQLSFTEQETAPNTSNSTIYNQYWEFDNLFYKGVTNNDYFVIGLVQDVEKEVTVETPSGTSTETILERKITNYYYYKVKTASEYTWTDAILLTSSIPYANETQVGGFRNVSADALDNGYVRLDENGYLYLLDYDLLRTGVLAYQLGEDYESPSGLTTEAIQEELDEYVNNRVAFANRSHLQKAMERPDVYNPNVINVTLELSAEKEPTTLYINNIDSRFNTAVYLHINGTADSNTTIVISNCEKIRIDYSFAYTSESNGAPNIQLYNSSLYYDSGVINKLSLISGLKLWYERFTDSDPVISVNGMTVQQLDSPPVTEDLSFWTPAIRNDNHIRYALQSVTFGNDGSIIGFGLFIQNSTTANVQPTSKSMLVDTEFKLPQGRALTYPESRLTRQLEMSGTFMTVYPAKDANNNSIYQAVNTTFSILSNNNNSTGTASFILDTFTMSNNIVGVESNEQVIDSFDDGAYHIFTGGALS